MENIIQSISSYILGLDWSYIMTFILTAYLVNYSTVRKGIFKLLRIKVKTRYRVAITGTLLGIALFYLRGYTFAQLETLAHSFVFALVFHKMILDTIMQYLTRTKPDAQDGSPEGVQSGGS